MRMNRVRSISRNQKATLLSRVLVLAWAMVSIPLASASITVRTGQSFVDRTGMRTGTVVSTPDVNASIFDRFAAPASEVCKKAYLSRLEFRDVAHPTLKNHVNYCDAGLHSIPAEALAVIERIGELHGKIAAALGWPVAEVFQHGIEVQLSAFVPAGKILLGSVSSEAGSLQWNNGESGIGVMLQILPNWEVADFADSIYAHEVIHLLAYSPGPVGDALSGLHDHPFLMESLPDLISAVVLDVPKFRLGERELPASLRDLRDGTPVQSLNAPFGDFYNLREMDQLAGACAKLNFANESEFTRVFCRSMVEGKPTAMADIETFTLNNRLERKNYDEESLLEPFAAADCRVVTRTGLVYFDNCDTHRFGGPLISFFFRLKELTGQHRLAALMAELRAGADRTAVYECGFSRGTATLGGAKAEVKIRPILGAFIALRESLDAAQQSAFDRAWREHGMDKMVDLDRLYRAEALAGFAQLFVKSRNTYYSREHGCGDVYNLDSYRCAVTCEKKR